MQGRKYDIKWEYLELKTVFKVGWRAVVFCCTHQCWYLNYITYDWPRKAIIELCSIWLSFVFFCIFFLSVLHVLHWEYFELETDFKVGWTAVVFYCTHQCWYLNYITYDWPRKAIKELCSIWLSFVFCVFFLPVLHWEYFELETDFRVGWTAVLFYCTRHHRYLNYITYDWPRKVSSICFLFFFCMVHYKRKWINSTVKQLICYILKSNKYTV